MSFEADVQFYMYSTDRFMNYAESFLKLTDQQEAIEEAREIRIQDIAHQIIIPDDILQTLADLNRSKLDTFDKMRHSMEQLQSLLPEIASEIEFIDKVDAIQCVVEQFLSTQ